MEGVPRPAGVLPHGEVMPARSDVQQPDDEALAAWLMAVAGGDREALAILYGQTSSRLLGVLVRLLRRREVAEEVLHDVYLRVWERARHFDIARGSPMGWLTVMARNAALDHLRRHRREVVGVEALEDVGEDAATPDLGAASATRRLLQACLDRLEPEPRRCVVLAYQAGLSYDQLAASLGRPVGTVKSWVRRSLMRLRQCLEQP
jgi:RNA polymerase sigma-70 factor (ECF subfamily)